jgi:hypothetical protein
VGEHEATRMSAPRRKVVLPPGMDLLCEALNTLPGVRTYESCCGHGQEPYRIWLHVAQPHRNLFCLTYWCWLAERHNGVRGWALRERTINCTRDRLGRERPLDLILEGHAGDFAGAEQIAKAIRERLCDRCCIAAGEGGTAEDRRVP